MQPANTIGFVLWLRRGRHFAEAMLFCCAVGLCIAVGCKPSAPAPPHRNLAAVSNVVARVGEAVITSQAFQREWQRRGGTADKSAVLEELIRFEAALAKAKAAGYDRHPDVTNRVNQLIVARFQEDRLKESANTPTASRDELLDYYRRHLDKFAVPEQARAAVLFWTLPPKAEPERQQEIKQRAQAMATHARHADADGFVQLVQANSEDQSTRYRGGDAGWLAHGATNAYWEVAVVDALFALRDPGEVTDVIATSRGLYVARLLERRPAATRPLDEVQDQIAYEVAREKRARLEQEYFDGLKAGLKVQINESVLDSIQPAQPSVEGKPPALPKG